jgi:hypothetical protein
VEFVEFVESIEFVGKFGDWGLEIQGDSSRLVEIQWRYGRDTGEMSGWLKHHSEHITRGTMPDLRQA